VPRSPMPSAHFRAHRYSLGGIVVSSTALTASPIFGHETERILDKCKFPGLRHQVAWMSTDPKATALGAAWAAISSNPIRGLD
jgi:hypothetical protein